MKSLRQHIAVIAAIAIIGSAQAQTAGQTFDLGTVTATSSPTYPTPAVQQFYDASGIAGAVTFADIVNFTIGPDHDFRAWLGGYIRPDVPYWAAHVSNMTATLYDGADGTGSALATTSFSWGGYQGQIGNVLADGVHSLRVSGTADGAAGGGFTLSVAANPEPAEWMLLLCGLVVAGFIARRKIGLAAG